MSFASEDGRFLLSRCGSRVCVGGAVDFSAGRYALETGSGSYPPSAASREYCARNGVRFDSAPLLRYVSFPHLKAFTKKTYYYYNGSDEEEDDDDDERPLCGTGEQPFPPTSKNSTFYCGLNGREGRGQFGRR